MTSDSRKLPAVGFSMDEAGTKLLHDLTQGNMSEHMAILLDGEVYSAPVIQGAISSSGIITMGTFDSHEVSTLIEILRAGVLPARIKSEPISITPFGPATDGDPKAPTTSAD
jgi:preprotein translocase subunit SecD